MQEPGNNFGAPSSPSPLFTPPPGFNGNSLPPSPIPLPTGQMPRAVWVDTNNDINNSGHGGGVRVPPGVRGFNLGAAMFPLFWSISNKAYIGLLCLVPYVGLVMRIYLLLRGNDLAWQYRRFDSVQHCRDTQRAWNYWGVGVLALIIVVVVIAEMSK